MRGDTLYRGIGDADDKYIQSAKNAFDNSKKSAKRKNAGRILKRVLSVAAAVIIIGGVWAVSFIVVLNRHDPVTPANTGDPADTKDEPSTEADTTFKLSPYVSEPTEVGPDCECGKMIQAFDAYLKTKEFGKYGDYYVSYCVKVNGKYIGFIDDGDTQYNDLIDIEVIDGLPFYYGSSHKLTVINGGEYRYGLDKAFNDGLLDSNDLDEFFIKYSSNNLHAVYESLLPSFLRKSCEEFLGGEDERNVIDKPEKDKEPTLYNYIHIAYCKKLSEYKYAVLYQLAHQPMDETDENEYYTLSAGGYDFQVYVGLKLNILDEYDNVYGLVQAQLSEDELKVLYDSYSEFMESAKKATGGTRTPEL